MKTIRIVVALLALPLVLPSALAQPAGHTDAELKAKLAQRLAQDPALMDDRLEVSVSNGVARVSGTVDTLWEAWKVREDVSAIFGVLDYEPQVSLESEGIPDASLGAAVGDALDRRLLSNPEVGTISASVQAGVVTLTGTVRDSRKRFEAREAVARQPGVRQIVDELLSPEAPDEEIQKAVVAILAGGTGLPVSGKVTTRVEDGVVTLTGTVPLLSARWQAEETAWGVNGVRAVVNELTVDPPSREIKVVRP